MMETITTILLIGIILLIFALVVKTQRLNLSSKARKAVSQTKEKVKSFVSEAGINIGVNDEVGTVTYSTKSNFSEDVNTIGTGTVYAPEVIVQVLHVEKNRDTSIVESYPISNLYDCDKKTGFVACISGPHCERSGFNRKEQLNYINLLPVEQTNSVSKEHLYILRDKEGVYCKHNSEVNNTTYKLTKDNNLVPISEVAVEGEGVMLRLGSQWIRVRLPEIVIPTSFITEPDTASGTKIYTPKSNKNAVKSVDKNWLSSLNRKK